MAPLVLSCKRAELTPKVFSPLAAAQVLESVVAEEVVVGLDNEECQLVVATSVVRRLPKKLVVTAVATAMMQECRCAKLSFYLEMRGPWMTELVLELESGRWNRCTSTDVIPSFATLVFATPEYSLGFATPVCSLAGHAFDFGRRH